MNNKTFFTTFFLLLFAAQAQQAAVAAEGFSTVEERMTDQEMQQTGLNKLTEHELAELNEWLRRHSVATLDNASARPASVVSASGGETRDMRGFENRIKDKSQTGDQTIHAHIVGTFDGWQGKGTLFKLDNGMIWKQAENDAFAIKEVENPEITIKKGFLGTWRLSVVGYASTVRVKRIQ